MHTPIKEDAPALELLPAALLAPTEDALDVAWDVAPDALEEPAAEEPPDVPLEPPTLLAMTLEDATLDVPEPLPPPELAPEEPIPEDATALELPARELLLTPLDGRELPPDPAALEEDAPLDDDDAPPPVEPLLLLLESPLPPVHPSPNSPAATVKPTAPRRMRIIQTPLPGSRHPLPRLQGGLPVCAC